MIDELAQERGGRLLLPLVDDVPASVVPGVVCALEAAILGHGEDDAVA